MTSVNIGWRRSSRCDTGACLEVHRDGDSVRLRESANPQHEVVTTAASWESWLQQARDEERARIVTWLRSRVLWKNATELADMIEAGDE